MITNMPNVDVLYTNQVQSNHNGLVTSYNVINPFLIDLASDPTYQYWVTLVLSQVVPMPINGFFRALQGLCCPRRVLVRNHATSPSQAQPLQYAFDCTDTLTATGHSGFRGFLMHAGLVVTGLYRMGYEGFISQSYHDEMYSLLEPDSHLLWNIFMVYDQPSGTAAVSEIDTCVKCEITDNAGFLVLGT